MTFPVTSRDLYNALKNRLGLEWIAGHIGSERNLRGDFPGAASQGLAGPLNYIHPNRIQIIGRAELSYFSGLDRNLFLDVMEKLFFAQPAAVLLADGVAVDAQFISSAEKSGTPLWHSSIPDKLLTDELQYFLTHALAERTTQHGVFMEVLGTGVLLTGNAATGKSELALELIARGHRLIADDAPVFSRIAPDIISGSCPALLQDFLEVRGLGVINIRTMFGDSAIKQEKYLRLIIRLQPMNELDLKKVDRLRGSYSFTDVLGIPISEVALPVAPGREMSILVEVAVRQFILQKKGYDATEEFISRQQQAIDRQQESK
ncbi:MAG: HPr(Ser) kinase/phosphatase [Gammaproteobacteria bacterium]|nr:HPr(Ser) kinase/phosphatase [Gammaproteobacteria bacterium]MCP5406414.1 HPr(Ser) kinase/phosphatase [Chromatiaceae bacterium]MCP5408082.1 HPr(Ser) kinase/phosphatase [Chromatiaceae bacterium]MCP5442981.1 HPr(Ser) kinase/phosphatase [Chromatiaceae bacterium]